MIGRELSPAEMRRVFEIGDAILDACRTNDAPELIMHALTVATITWFISRSEEPRAALNLYADQMLGQDIESMARGMT